MITSILVFTALGWNDVFILLLDYEVLQGRGDSLIFVSPVASAHTHRQTDRHTRISAAFPSLMF